MTGTITDFDVYLGKSPPANYTLQILHGYQTWCFVQDTLPETKIAPENGWLEDDPFLLGKKAYCQGVYLSFRESILLNDIGIGIFNRQI